MSNILRPGSFSKFIGQNSIKKTIKIMIKSATTRHANLDHVLLTGKPGTGKTTLANLIAKDLKVNIKHSQGASLEKKSDLLALIGAIKTNDIIFIDEIHSLNKQMEELLYNIMDDAYIDIVLGPDGDSKIVRLKIPNFCLIGATTKIDIVSKPLHDRFGIIFKMQTYTFDELATIAKNSFLSLKFDSSQEANELLAISCMHNPRILNNLVKRVIDFAVIKKTSMIAKKDVVKAFETIGIYDYGLNHDHIEYLKLLAKLGKSKYASLTTIANILKTTKANVEKSIESDLLFLQLIQKNSRGRKMSKIGIKYLLKNKLL